MYDILYKQVLTGVHFISRGFPHILSICNRIFIEKMTWKDFREMVGDEWTPGMNTPFDPIAAKLCEKNDTTVLIMGGNDLDNLKRAMEDGEFFGTVLCAE